MKERVITGCIMALVALLAIRFLPSGFFQFALLVIALIGVFEWKKMLPETIRLPYLMCNTLLLVIAYMFLLTNTLSLLLIANTVAVCVWILVPFLLFIQIKMPQKWLVSKEVTAIFSTIMLLGFYISLSMLHELPGGYGYGFVLYVIGLVALADSGAYFVGRKFGKNKLAPAISPGKTIEGAIGGIMIAMVFSLIVMLFLPISFNGWQKIAFLLISLIAAMLSITGDLYESLIKRHAGIKDSGNLFPGHGGVLDRIDGLIAGATIFTYGFYIF
ncbi:phosphatidate cytidylyltransferase [Wohlfahrtiimonas larvae]|uniref:Phosphatidate cytidylyltransferase n=1 Tax=Wohlfahrtiimonas larvae TaxID=1157986 RepID=A0ABP9MM99_9GAMM|nr:phosphatidate cytidylyltransferase [Wohlfahrtiimonas larvae]